jgi:hypothetical protein
MEKTTVSKSQGTKMADLNWSEINLKKPRSAYNFFLKQLMKDKGLDVPDASRQASAKWPTVEGKQKEKYEQMAADDRKRYEENLESAQNYLTQNRPLKEKVSPYRFFQMDHVKKATKKGKDMDDAKKEASEKWAGMDADARRKWTHQAEEHTEFFSNLKHSGKVTPFSLFVKEKMTKSTKGGPKRTLASVAAKWKELKETTKEKYQEFAREENEDRKKHRLLYELVSGVKPRRPANAYRFFLMEQSAKGTLKGMKSLGDASTLFEKLKGSEKERYQRMADRAKVEYTLQKMAYDAKNKTLQGRSKARSAYNFFVQDLKNTDSKKFEKQGFFVYAKKQWESLSDKDRKKYDERADEDKVNLEKEKAGKVFEKPKGLGGPFAQYVKDHYADAAKKNPSKETQEIVKVLGSQWRKLGEKEKEKYQPSGKASETYKSQLKQFNSQGYYESEEKGGSKRGSSKKDSSESRSRRGSTSKGKKRKSMK